MSEHKKATQGTKRYDLMCDLMKQGVKLELVARRVVEAFYKDDKDALAFWIPKLDNFCTIHDNAYKASMDNAEKEEVIDEICKRMTAAND
jgi:hypothetical protein